MSDLFFVMPAYRRHELTRLCLRHLKVTCDELGEYGFEATAVVIADEPELLEPATELGFYTIRQENDPLGRKFNDGFELAAREGAKYVLPIGSDNWIDSELVRTTLPEPGTVACHRDFGAVREDGKELAFCRVSYPGGDGIRTYPISLFAGMNYRPAADHAKRAIDTSIVERLRRFTGWSRRYVYEDLHDLQVVSFQSTEVQLNPYDDLVRSFGYGTKTHSPWTFLKDVYDWRSVDEMRELYESRVPA